MGGATVDIALDKLRRHDYGPLTKHIATLYRRVTTRIDRIRAWVTFAADTGSSLISKFTETYVKGVEIGGIPRKIGDIIGTNFLRITALRKHRYQTSASLMGVLYGLCVGIAFCLYLSLNIIGMLNNMFGTLNIANSTEYPTLPVLTAGFNVSLIELIILVIIIIHASASSLLIAISYGGHKFSSLLHFPILFWVGAIISEISKLVMVGMLSIGIT
jgi:flagellar protein FlaJ